CHNQKTKIPAGAPLYLDTANLNDPAADAAVWEKVIRKLGVGAMPPQGAASPENAKLTEFRTWLMTALDQAAAERNNPGRYVLHRLNRTEYANAIRDLLGVEIDVTDMLPSDGGDFGFDNVASALKTSPLLLERYLTAALYISDLAVGTTEVPPGTTTFNIGYDVTQDQHMPGLPLGTRGGTLVHYNFPADAEYVLAGRLLNTIIEGAVGVEGQETPHQFIITIDGQQVYSTPIGGKDDHELSTTPIRKRLFLCRPASGVPASVETTCARKILATVARRAFRRPVNEGDLQAPMTFYADARQNGDFDAGIRAGLARILASPSFV